MIEVAIKAMELGPDGAIVRNITLFAVLIYEIAGPYLTKVALTAAGEIKSEGKTSARGSYFDRRPFETHNIYIVNKPQ